SSDLNANTTFSGVISGANTLTKVGTGTQTLSGANTYGGATAVQNGTVQLAVGPNRLPINTAVTLGSGTNSGVLDLNGQSQQLQDLYTSATGAAGAFGNASSAIVVGDASDRFPIFSFTPTATGTLTTGQSNQGLSFDISNGNTGAQLNAESGGVIGVVNYSALWTGKMVIT